MSNALNALLALKNDRRGVTAIEYGMIVALISVLIIGSITTIGTKLSAAFASIATSLPAAP